MTDHHDRVAIAGSEREPIAGARATGNVPGDEHIEVTVVVRPRAGTPTLDATRDYGLAAPRERRYLTREAFAAAHGASDDDLEAVEAFAAEHDLTVLESSAARRSVALGGTAAAMSAAFGVSLQRYAHDGGSYRGRTGAVHVPASLGGIVEAVLGLDDRPVAQPHFRIGSPPGAAAALDPRAAAAAFTPPQLAELYEFPAAGDGSGECIAIVELGGGYRRSDVKAYFSSLGIPAPHVTAISVDGAHNKPTGDPNGPDGEVALDIQVAGGVAPGAQLAVYFAPNTDRGFLDAITKALHDTRRKPSVISISWGQAESGWTQQSLQAFDAAFASAAALGVTILCAAGDDGSNDRVGDNLAHADFPASSPHVVACGGTRLEAANGAISNEVVWHESSGGAGGGGISDVFDLPSYQAGLSVPPSANPGARVGRGLPDLAADADPQTGYNVLIDGQRAVFGGTSAVAPLIAGLIARINQQDGHAVGFLNPLLYAGIGAGGACRDITSGDIGAYAAGTGWDCCTGFGSPVGASLASALASSEVRAAH